MIGSLRGTVIHKADSWVVLETESGVGYRVFTGNQQLLDKQVLLYIHHHVREESSDLYGFLSYPELAMFETLLGVSGVGPKMSANLLTSLGRDTIIDAISSNQPAIFKSVSGVGQKVAEKIILELKSKLGKANLSKSTISDSTDVIDALTNLGYHQSEIMLVLHELDQALSTGEQLKQALKRLAN